MQSRRPTPRARCAIWNRAFVGWAAALGLAFALPGMAAAQDVAYPKQPIRIIAPTGAGGSLDSIARLMAMKLSQVIGQSVFVENRPGAGGIIGAEFVAKAPPDGYTVLISSAGNLTTTPALYKNMPFNPVKDFAPVSLIAYDPYVLVANPSLDAKSVADLIKLAKAHPGQINFASSGNGSAPHLAGALMDLQAGITLQHVPYTTSAAGLTSVVSGQTSLMFTGIVSGLPFIQSGQLRALGVAGPTRLPMLPDVPPIADTLHGFNADNWAGFLMPAKTPPAIVNKFHDAIIEVLKMPDVQERLKGFGLRPAGTTPAAFAEFIRNDVLKWIRVVDQSHIQIN